MWFFGGTRIERSTTSSVFAQTGIPYTSTNDNARYEAKLTGMAVPGHTLQGTFIDNKSDRRQPSIGSAIDPATMGPVTTTNRLFAATWRASLGARTFVTAQYSQKDWTLQIGENPGLAIQDSPFLTRGVLGVPGGLLYNAQYFDPTDPEQRNNRQFTGSVTHMLASPSWGTHELKAGGRALHVHARRRQLAEHQRLRLLHRLQGERQLPGARRRRPPDPALRPRLVAAGHVVPGSRGRHRRAHGVALRERSLDRRAAAHPRSRRSLRARDQRRDRRHLRRRRLGAHAADRRVVRAERGRPHHAAGNLRPLLRQVQRRAVLAQLERRQRRPHHRHLRRPAGEGRDFAPGFDPANYQTFTGTFPTANVFYDDNLSSPLTREFTLAVAREIGRAGWARATYVKRHATDFVEDFITMDGGQTVVNRSGANLGAFDNVWYRNSAEPKRDYQAIVLQGAYSPASSLRVNGDWTVQIENDGTFEGESSSGPGLASIIGDYPEIYTPRAFPDGRLDDFQRHKVRLWTTWSARFGRFGSLDLAPLFRYNSARTYSLTASVPLTAAQIARNPGYARLPSSQTIYFGARGSQDFAGYGLVDFAATYGVPVWQSVRPWVKIEVLNLLDNDTLIAWNTAVTADTAGARDENGLPLGYITGTAFGTASGTTSYPRPRPGMDGGRTFLVSAGVRF